jgi:acylphosphatase
MTELAKAKLAVTGRVQGVFYRQSTRDMAHSLGLAGWVRNQDDGSVAIEVIGPKPAIERMIAWAQKGPPHARVDNVAVEWLEPAATERGAGFHIVG